LAGTLSPVTCWVGEIFGVIPSSQNLQLLIYDLPSGGTHRQFRILTNYFGPD